MHHRRRSLPSLVAIAFIAMSVIAAPVVTAEDTTEVTLTGQIVCTACWAEQDDRVAHPYGTDGDMKCAARCSTRNVTQSVAVWSNGKAELVVLERGAFEMKDKDFLSFVAKEVEVRGTVRTDGGKRYLKVNSLRVVAERPAPKGRHFGRDLGVSAEGQRNPVSDRGTGSAERARLPR